MRTFLGIFPTEEITAIFRNYKQQLRKQKQNLKFVPAPDIHITLKFLGPDVSRETMNDLLPVFRNLFKKYEQFEIILSKVQFGFEHDAKPRILLVKIKENEEINELVRQIENLTPRKKYSDLYPPRGRFVPHFTLGRIRGNIHRKKINEIREAVGASNFEGAGKRMLVKNIRLINSVQGKEGMVYHTLEEFDLKPHDVSA